MPMHTRRTVIVSMMSSLTTFSIARAADDNLPKATVITGKPPILDFGDGLKVPCDKSAFLTLWESSSVWLTFGFGSSGASDFAKSRARYHAMGTMRYLLLTLAFAPDRLKQVDSCGWRQKDEKPSNYVMGDLDLPGRASRPLDDVFIGAGVATADAFWDAPNAGGTAAVSPSIVGGPEIGASGMNPSMTLNSVNAFCCYVVKKTDLSLNDVRLRANILKI